MKYFMFPTIVLAFFIALSSFQADEWDLIGMKTVKYDAEKDELLVDAPMGPYNYLKVFVEDAPVHVYEMKIMYEDGTFQIEKMYRVIADGGKTDDIRLTGKRIDKIQFVYATPLRAMSDNGQVLVFGKKAMSEK